MLFGIVISHTWKNVTISYYYERKRKFSRMDSLVEVTPAFRLLRYNIRH